MVFLTGYGDVPTSVSAMKRGAVDFLTKPVDQTTLLRTVAEAIERHGAERRDRQRRQATDDRLARLSPQLPRASVWERSGFPRPRNPRLRKVACSSM